jgi:hypothetical protein
MVSLGSEMEPPPVKHSSLPRGLQIREARAKATASSWNQGMAAEEVDWGWGEDSGRDWPERSYGC